MKKIPFFIVLFAANYLLALIFLKVSPVCNHYVNNSFSNISDFLLLTISVPMYWILGIFVIPFIIKTLLELLPNDAKYVVTQPVIWSSIGAAMSLISLFVLWKKLSMLRKKIIISLSTFFINFACLESFFISMGV